MRRLLYFLLLFLLVIPVITNAQKSRKWKKMRYEIIAGLGATNFLGELGGADKIGTHFLNDFEISQTRPLLYVGGRYKFYERVAIKTGIFWGWLSGNDNKTKEPARQYRNLSFRSPIVEWNNQIEYSIVKEPRSQKYSIQKVPGITGLLNFKTNTYIFTGVNVFYFNPKANYNGTWIALQPLGTEGQGILPTRSKYSRVSVSIPIGLGFKWVVTRLWCVGLEYGYRKTFTDYIDDVSKSFVDPGIFNDPVAAALSNRSGELSGNEIPEGANASWTAPGAKRGDSKYTDSYMFMNVTLVYKLRTSRGGRPMF